MWWQNHISDSHALLTFPISFLFRKLKMLDLWTNVKGKSIEKIIELQNVNSGNLIIEPEDKFSFRFQRWMPRFMNEVHDFQRFLISWNVEINELDFESQNSRKKSMKTLRASWLVLTKARSLFSSFLQLPASFFLLLVTDTRNTHYYRTHTARLIMT